MEYWCIKCEDEVNPKRVELGYKTCLKCGASEARTEIIAKMQRTAPICNKSGYFYITDGMVQNDLKSLGRKL